MTFRFVPAGDSVVVVEGPDRLDAGVNRLVIHLTRRLEQAHLRGVRDVVPAFRSLAIFFDPLLIDRSALEARVQGELQMAASAESPTARSTLRVPVCYGGTLGPDLAAVAAFAGMSEAGVIEVHAAPVYRVYMLGFLPGFAYLGAVDGRIAAPRHPSPRLRVPAGSVGIAGLQTGIYPVESPGGWQLIGQTPLRPFNPERAEPFMFEAGDDVQFYPVTEAEFATLARTA